MMARTRVIIDYIMYRRARSPRRSFPRQLKRPKYFHVLRRMLRSLGEEEAATNGVLSSWKCRVWTQCGALVACRAQREPRAFDVMRASRDDDKVARPVCRSASSNYTSLEVSCCWAIVTGRSPSSG